jgi:hypothetical protein
MEWAAHNPLIFSICPSSVLVKVLLSFVHVILEFGLVYLYVLGKSLYLDKQINIVSQEKYCY